MVEPLEAVEQRISISRAQLPRAAADAGDSAKAEVLRAALGTAETARAETVAAIEAVLYHG
jgi:hypothetical protein